VNRLKKKIKKTLSIIAAICLFSIFNQVRTYPHIPLKGLFEVLNNGDIGFGHALLHSKWIENVYQYAEGKPHRQVRGRRNREQWNNQEKNDAVANLIRTFWFRASEDHQLLPTQFGPLAKIPNERLGVLFGKLINYVYMGCPELIREELIDELVKYDPDYAKLRQKLTVHWKELIDEEYKLKDEKFACLQGPEAQRRKEQLQKKTKELQEHYKIIELNNKIVQASKKWGKKKGFSKVREEIKKDYDTAGYNKALKEARENAFGGVPKKLKDEYGKTQAEVRKIDAAIAKIVRKKKDAIKKALFYPIDQALVLCKKNTRYTTRTTEGILWALFFHKLGSLVSMEEKIKAINDCFKEIENEYKYEEFCSKQCELKDLYSKKDFDEFENNIKVLEVDKQVGAVSQNYDIALHYFVSLVGGKLPPVIGQGNYGYEYESGKLSYARPNCHEAAMLDAISILWYNPQIGAFDDSLFPKHVIENGKGFKKLRKALKYFYLADTKGIKASRYTFEYAGSFDGATLENSGHRQGTKTFTSLGKLKSLGRISKEELKALSISDVPVFYINRSEIKQEFMNIVSGLLDEGVIYCSKVEGKGKIFELDSDVRNVVTIFNYFYGTNVQYISQLGDEALGISTDVRSVMFSSESFRNAPNKIKIKVNDFKTFSDFEIIIDIDGLHTSLIVPDREKKSSKILKKGFAQKIFNKSMLHDLQDRTIFTLCSSKKFLKDTKMVWNAPDLHLVYYALEMKKPEVKLEIIKDILERRSDYYESYKEMIYNTIESLPDDRYLNGILNKIIMISGFYKRDSFFENIISKYTSEQLFSDVVKHTNGKQEDLVLNLYQELEKDIKDINKHQVITSALYAKYKKVVALILEREEFLIDKNPRLFDSWSFVLEIALKLGFAKFVLDVVNHEKYNFRDADAILKVSLDQYYEEVALAIVNNEKFEGDGRFIGDALSIAFRKAYLEKLGRGQDRPMKKGYEQVVSKIIENPLFGDQQLRWALKFANDNGWKDIVFALVKHEKFNGDQVWCNKALEMALSEGDVQEALAIIQSKNFDVGWIGNCLLYATRAEGSKYCMKNALKVALENRYQEIALEIVKHPTFSTRSCWIDDFLETLEIFARRFEQTDSERYREIREVIQIVKNRKAQEDEN